MGKTIIRIENVTKAFGRVLAVDNVSLNIEEGEFFALLGPSGCGKTTLLRMIAGFELPTEGRILIDDADVSQVPPNKRPVNMVFQSYAVFPHMTVFDNVSYGLRVSGIQGEEVTRRVAEALTLVQLQDYGQRKPDQLSGGQRQRVALARALVKRPRVLLLDEPLSALDANLRRQMQVELKALQREVGITFIFVTHDQEEAMVMSDRIALLRSGELEQVASPREIYSRPATAYTAQFIGHTNLLKGEVRAGKAMTGIFSWPTSLPDGPVLFSLRPECIRFSGTNALSDSTSSVVRFNAKLCDQVFHGANELWRIECADGQVLTVRTSSQSLDSGDNSKDLQFAFDSTDAVPVRPSEERI